MNTRSVVRFSGVVSSLFLALSLGFGAGVGCGGGRYVITTTSGAKIITATKPRLVDSNYVFKDANGATNRISTLRVRVVEPYSGKAAGTSLKVPELK